MLDFEAIHHRYTQLSPHLDERGRRMFAAAEARAAGYGGIAAVSRATGLAASTIGRGLKELVAAGLEGGRIRRHGGGRKALVVSEGKRLHQLLTRLARRERGA